MEYIYVKAKITFGVNRDYILPYDNKYSAVYRVSVGEIFKIKTPPDAGWNRELVDVLSIKDLLVMLNKDPNALDKVKEML